MMDAWRQSGSSRCFTRALWRAKGPLALALLMAAAGATSWSGLTWWLKDSSERASGRKGYGSEVAALHEGSCGFCDVRSLTVADREGKVAARAGDVAARNGDAAGREDERGDPRSLTVAAREGKVAARNGDAVDRWDMALRLVGSSGAAIASVEWTFRQTSNRRTAGGDASGRATDHNGSRTIALVLLSAVLGWALLRETAKCINSRRLES